MTTEFNITAKIEKEPDVKARMSNATYRGSFQDLTPEEKASLKGAKGDKGDRGISGVYIGKDEPTDEEFVVWIDPDDELTDYQVYVRDQIEEKVGTLTNIEIENLLGGDI